MPVFYSNTASVMGGASAATAGSTGLVPAPVAGKNLSFLRGDATWTSIPVIQTRNPAAADDSSLGFASGSFWLNTTTQTLWVNVSSAVGNATWKAVGVGYSTQYIVPTNGQTVFTLPSVPTDPSSVVMSVNGVEYRAQDGDFILSGTTVTWSDQFQIASTDDLYFVYV